MFNFSIYAEVTYCVEKTEKSGSYEYEQVSFELILAEKSFYPPHILTMVKNRLKGNTDQIVDYTIEVDFLDEY